MNTANIRNGSPFSSPSPVSSLNWLDENRWFWGIQATVILWKVFSAWKLGLIFDECYYWEWSLHPQACYFDHPPLTAWLIALGHAILGQNALAVRVSAILAGLILALFGRALAREMFGTSGGNRAGILLTLAPIFAGNSFLMTPDSWLITAWAVAVYFGWKASRVGGSVIWWMFTGVAAGIGMLSKYTMVLFYVALCGACLFTSGRRIRLLLGVTLSSIISLVIFLPVLIWNSSHDWISFQHQFHHGFRNEHPGLLINFSNLGEYFLFLLVLVSPVLGIFCFRSATTRLQDERFRYLASFFWTVVLLFGFSAAKAHIEANWPMTAFVTGLIMVAGDWQNFKIGWRRLALIILLLADFGGVVGVSCLSFPGESPKIPHSFNLENSWPGDSKGSGALASVILQGYSDIELRFEEFRGPRNVADAIRLEFIHSGANFLCPSTYQLYGVLAYYAPDLEPLLWLPYQGRLRFPWIKYRDWDGKTALVVSWPRNNTDYHWLFTQLSSCPPILLEGMRTPVFAAFGKGFRPEMTTDH